jgi:myo-inositol-1(or 4)-monophosphatase
MNAEPDVQQLLEGCVAAAEAAGRHALDHFSRRTETVQVLAHDVKLALDVESQAAAVTWIRKRFPSHAILGEETGLREKGEFRWIVDPIDGTVNFSHGIPYWGTSVAVQWRGRTLAGAIWLPMLNEWYTATATGPALLNGSPIHVSGLSELGHSILYTGMLEVEGDGGLSIRVTIALASAVRKLRILGSAAAELCYVAAGRGEGYIETTIHLWDLAAGALLVERAGGRCEVLEDLGDYTYRFLATNGHIHDAAAAVVRPALRGGDASPTHRGAP